MIKQSNSIVPLALAIVISAIVFGGVSYYKVIAPKLSQTTGGWKIYTNTKYGFNFRYPSTVSDPEEDGLISTSANSESYSFYLYIKNSDYEKTGEASNIAFYIYDTPTEAEKGLTLRQYVDKAVENASKKTDIRIGDKEAINVSFIKGSIQVGGSGSIVEDANVLFVKHDDYYLTIRPTLLNKSRTQDQVIFDSILDTLVFTK